VPGDEAKAGFLLTRSELPDLGCCPMEKMMRFESWLLLPVQSSWLL
jgi:hypothetical protein